MGKEVALHGVSAAPGVATGKAVVLDRASSHQAIVIPLANRAAELELARHSLDVVATEMEQIASGLREAGRLEEADIVETGALMAADPGLASRVDELVTQFGRTAADALREASEDSAKELAQLPDPRLAERADDVRSIGRRAAARANGVTPGAMAGVLVAATLGPADVAEIAMNVIGIALAGGGVTAHAAIVARSLGMPMVVGLGPDVLNLRDGEEVVLDGDAGVLFLQPEPDRLAAARADADRRQAARRNAVARRLDPAQTTDGHRLTVLANAASVAEVIEALEQGAEGVGLLRSELSFLDAHAWPSRAQHLAFLKPILARLEGKTATVRLLDFGGDKTPPFLRGTVSRGIDLLLESPDALKDQLAAIVGAGEKVKLRVLVPMVTSSEQLRGVRQVLATVLDGRPTPQVGAMIETPEAARDAGEIAGACDFLSIGTNDLTQLVLGLDREHSKSAPVTDLRVLRLIDSTVRAGREAGIPVDVCGEAASDAVAMPILVGLAVDELSVAAARVGVVRESIRGLSFAASREAAEKRLLGQPADAARKGR
jgi:phosphoenolpyruvate-protein kinase (PTS system EI component)